VAPLGPDRSDENHVRAFVIAVEVNGYVLGENGRRAIAERYNWEAELAKLEGLYQAVV
jgi:hypothetical protein